MVKFVFILLSDMLVVVLMDVGVNLVFFSMSDSVMEK